MNFTILLALLSLVSCQTSNLNQVTSISMKEITPALLFKWNSLYNITQTVSKQSCLAELGFTFNQANIFLRTTGLNPNFTSFLDVVRLVAGDLPETASFIQVILTCLL